MPTFFLELAENALLGKLALENLDSLLDIVVHYMDLHSNHHPLWHSLTSLLSAASQWKQLVNIAKQLQAVKPLIGVYHLFMEHSDNGFTLALGGGGARGFAHVGVFHVLQDRGVPIRGVVGTSSGAVAGAGYALGFTYEEMRQRVMEFAASPLARHPRLKAMRGGTDEACQGLTDKLARLYCQGLLVKSFFLDNSLLGGEFFREMVDFFLPMVRLEDTYIPFAAVATDIKSGEVVVLNKGDMRKAVRASCSVPGVAAPVRIDGRHLVDGGASCLVPTPIARRLAPCPVLAINVDRDIGTQDLPAQSLEYYLRATEIQGYHLAEMLCGLAEVVLRPALGDVHWADFSRSAWIMEQGAKAAEQAWDQIEALLKPQAPWWRRALGRGARRAS